MPRQNSIQTSWTKGEVSPLAAGRVDVNLYASGAKTIENLIVRPQGPLFRRSGTKFVRATKLSTAAVRVIPFAVSDETAYVLEFGDSYIHLYKHKEPLLATTREEIESFTVDSDGGLMRLTTSIGNLPGWGNINAFYSAADNGEITLSAGAGGTVRVTTTVPHTLRTGALVIMRSNTDPNSINNGGYTVTRISNYAVDLQGSTYVSPAAAPDNVAMMSHGLLAGDRIYISDGAEYPELSNQWHVVKSVGGITVTIANVTYAAHGTPTGEEVHCIPIEIVTTYTTAQLPDLKYVQSNDVLYLFHPDHPTRKLVRLTDDGDREDWLLATVDFQDGPYLPLNSLAPTVDETTPANGTVFADVALESSGYVHTATVNIPSRAVAATAGTGARVLLTLANHGLVNGDLVVVSGSIASVNGNWVVMTVTTNTFELTASTYAADSVAGTWKPAFRTTDDSLYIEYRDGDQWRLAQLPATMADYDVTATVSIIDNVLLYLDETVKLQNKPKKPPAVTGSESNSAGYYRGPYQQQQILDSRTSVKSGAAAAGAGTVKSEFSNTFAHADVGKFVRYLNAGGTTAYWAQITAIPSGAAGADATHAAAVSMAGNNATGRFFLTAEARSSTVTAYRSAATFAAFASTDVGRMVRLGFGGRWTWGAITAYTSTSVVTVGWETDMPRDPHNAANVAGALNGAISAASTTGRTFDWRLGSWSETTGYPTCGAFHEQRLWLANTSTQPQTFWGSTSGDFENMAPTEFDSTVLDDSAIAYTLGSTQANPIKWLISGPAMHIGTSGGEWQVRASSSAQEAITPSNIKATEYTGHGSGSSLPARIGSSVVFSDRSTEKVHEIFYAYEQDAVDSDDLTIISEHILRDHGGVVRTAFQQKPHSIFWAACGDGTLAGMTFNKKQEVVAWHHHTIASGTVEDICVIPSEDSTTDEVWLVVARTVNGSTVRYIEVLESDYYPASASTRTGMRFPDCHRVIEDYTGTAISGLGPWEGLAVVVVRDGVRVAGTSTVTSGAITLSASANEVVIGLLPSCYVQSLPPEGGSQFGTSQGQMKRVVYLDCRFLSTGNVSFGPATDNLIAKTLPGNPSWFTGTDRLVPAHGYDEESSWVISQPEPYPLNLLFAVTKLETNE